MTAAAALRARELRTSLEGVTTIAHALTEATIVLEGP
jgi:hypothetical protein